MPPVSVKVNYGNILSEIQIIQFDVDKICENIKDMPDDGLMVEWGSGGSTCRWIETLTNKQKLISIEHNENWYNRVTRAISAEFGDVKDKFTFYHIPEKYIQHGYGNIGEEHPCGTDEYLNPIDDSVWDADIYFIDGIARGACLTTIMLKRRKRNSVIMIHDHVGRETWYSWAVQHFDVKVFTEQDEFSTLAILTQKNS